MRDIPKLSLFLILLLFTAFAWPTLDNGAHDARMLQVISLDEAGFLNVVRTLHDTGDLSIGHYTYPALYPYLTLVLVKVQAMVGSVSDAAIIGSLRFVCLAAGLLTLVLTYRLGATLFNPETGATAAALLASAPVFFRWSVEAHPDMPQLAFVGAALYALARAAKHENLRDLIASSLFAGLAMGTKYSGFLLAPAVVFVLFRSGIEPKMKLQAAVACLLVFAAAFTLTNPYVLIDWDRFTADLSFIGRIVSDAPNASPFAWFGVLFSSSIGLLVGGLFVIACILSAGGKGPLARRDDHLAVIIFALTCILFLIIRVRFVHGRYLLPALPALVVVAASVLPSRCRALGLPGAARIAIIAAVALGQVTFTKDLWSARVRDLTEDPVIASGLWLEETYGSDTSILFDTYAYVPSTFKRAYSVFGSSYAMIHLFAPDLLVTRSSIRERYRSPDFPSDFRLTDGPVRSGAFVYLERQRYKDIHYTYDYLEKGSIFEYSLVRDFGDVTVYGRRERTDPKHWELVRDAHATGMIPAAAAADAFMAFGGLHATSGNYPQATFQYRKASEALGDDPTANDNLAASLAYQDSVESAVMIWEKAAEKSKEPAGIWIRAGWALYASGHHEASREASRRAIVLVPNHPYPRLNIALTYLVEDNIESADSAYAAVLKHEDLPEATASILRGLKEKEDLSPEGKALIDRLLSQHTD